jgi:hypothetical protein
VNTKSWRTATRILRFRAENKYDYIYDLFILTEIYKTQTQGAYLSTNKMLRSERNIVGFLGYDRLED